MSLSIAELRGRALAQPERNALFTNTDLDELLGSAGIPRGRLTEVFGGPSSGKTSVAFAVLAACTNAGLLAAYVDAAGTFYAPAAAGAGIRLAQVLVVRPPTADMARRAVDALVRCGACALVVFDCAGLGDVLRAHQCARLASQAEKTDTALLALSSGNVPALASFASLRLRLSGLKPVWQKGSAGGGQLAGCVTSIEVVKSRMSAPGRSAAIQALLPDIAGSWPLHAPLHAPLHEPVVGQAQLAHAHLAAANA
jgi:RecA/RadA recombinase